MFNVANQFVTKIATLFGGAGSSVLLDTSSTTPLAETDTLFGGVFGNLWATILSAIGNIILAISQFALMFIDLIQMIVYKFLGISMDISEYNGYDPNNPLLKFMFNDRVMIVLRSVFAIAAVLVLVFSIFSIIRGEYNKAANDTDYSVTRVWGRAIRAMLGMTIFPVLFLAIVILVNAILGGFAYALSGGNSSYTLGSQVMMTSSYQANVYRNYADANRRIPIFINFEDPVDQGYDSRYTKEELVAVYDAFSSDGKEIYNMFANNDFPTFNESVSYSYANNSMVNDSKNYGKYEKFICTADQYYVMADFIDYALANNVTYYYKPIVDADIEWKYVSDTVYDKVNQIMTIKYQDAKDPAAGDYAVSYKASSYTFTSPVQDAMTSLSTLLSLNIDVDNDGYRMLDYVAGSINKVQWATNKVRVKLSANYNDKNKWTALDQLLLYEYYRYSYNNTFQNYTISDLIDGVDLDLYTISTQYLRTYTKRYVNLNVEKGAIINGNYFKVKQLVENDEYVYDDYGDPVYTIDTSLCDRSKVLNDMSAYNADKSNDEKLGVHIAALDTSSTEAWYSATYSADGAPYTSIVDSTTKLRYPGNLFYKAMISTKGYAVKDNAVVSKIVDADLGDNEFNYVVNNPDVEYRYLDPNGFWHEPERVYAEKNVKKVSWPSKLVADMKAIYRELNLSQLIATGEWLDAFNSSVTVDANDNYVASFDTSLISPQGLVFSEIFLSDIAESDGSTLSKYMFVSKYSEEEIRAMMLALLGEYYYETATTTINYFIDTFNMLFAPLLEKILDGEGQPYTDGEVISTQLYTYKAYLASLLLSNDCANFFMEIAKSIIDMYSFGYDILAVQPEDNSFALGLVKNYRDRNGVGIVTLDDLGINWRQYFESATETESFQQFLTRTYSSSSEISEDNIPLALLDAINAACADKYLPFADVILNDNANVQYSSDLSDEDMQYGLKLTFEVEQGGTNVQKTLKEYLSGYTYNPDTKYIKKSDGTTYYSWQQLTEYEVLATRVYEMLKADMSSSNPTTKLGKLYVNAKKLLDSQGSSIPEYLKYFVYYVTGQTDKIERMDVLLSGLVSIDRASGMLNEYSDYASRLEAAKDTYKTVKDKVYKDSENASFNAVVLAFYQSDAVKQYSNATEFNSVKNLYGDGVSTNPNSTESNNYLTQINNLDRYLIELENMMMFAASSDTLNGEIVSHIANYRSALSNLFSLQRTVDSLHKYFFTYAVRMQTTESAIKDFIVVINNHSYNLSITMPTAKLAEYVVGAKYLEKLGYETMFVDSDYSGFLDIGYDDRLPAAGEDVEFKTMNKFVDNLADITVQSYYMSNLFNITDANIDNDKLVNLKYYVDEDGNSYLITDKPGAYNYQNFGLNLSAYKQLPSYMQLILQKIFDLPNALVISASAADSYRLADTGMLSIKHVGLSDKDISNISAPSIGEGVDQAKLSDVVSVFNNTLGYILGTDGTDYSDMTMQQIRLEMIDAIKNYETSSKDSADDDSRRYLTLFNLFCSDFVTFSKNDKLGITYSTDITTKSIVMRMAGMQNKPEELLVNLEYESLYDNIGFDENKGDYFIICTYDETTRMFLPVLMTNGLYSEAHFVNSTAEKYWADTGLNMAHTNYYPAYRIIDGQEQQITQENEKNVNNETEMVPLAYPLIAKGIITTDGLPTAIRQVAGSTEFYRRNVVIRNASDLNLSEYYMSIEDISVSMNIFQRFTNSLSKLFTGKTLVEHAYESRPFLSVSSHLNLPMGVTTYTQSLNNEAIEMHYSFRSVGGLSSQHFYDTGKMNFAILLLAIVVLIPIVLKAMWGVMRRVLMITIYFIMSPVMFSTIALGREEKGDKDKVTENIKMYDDWMKKIMRETVSVFAYVFAFQIFFIIIPFISSGEFDFFRTQESISFITSIKMFSWVSPWFINMLIRLIFLVCSAYLITLAPPLFAKVMGQDDGIAQGAKMKSDIDKQIKEVQDVVSGKKAVDFANYTKEQLKQAIPGYEIAVAVKDKIQATKAKIVNAVAQVAGTVMKAIPATAAYADAVKKAGKMYKEQTMKELETKKALRDAKKLRANAYLKGIGVEEFATSNKDMKAVNEKLAGLGYSKENYKKARANKRQLSGQYKETRRKVKQAKRDAKK